MKKILGIVVLGMLMSWNANATYTAIGFIDCGDVITADKNNNKTVRYQVSDWVKGYITGRNYPNKQKPSKDIDADSLFYKVLNYCKKNPLKDTAQAAETIYEVLK